MASVETTETFACSPEQFFKIITDYNSYSEFLDEIESCTVIEDQGSRKLVEYKINLIKSFKYRLWMEEDSPNSLNWSLDSGDLFKASNGSWELREEDGQTVAKYQMEAKFKVFIPGPITKTVMNVNLPNMMKAYHKRVSELY